LKVRSFKIRGSGEIDNVSLTKRKTKENGFENNSKDLEKKFTTAEGQKLLKSLFKLNKDNAYQTLEVEKGVKAFLFSKHQGGNDYIQYAYLAVDGQSKYAKNFLGLTYVKLISSNKIKVLGYTKDIFASKEYLKNDLYFSQFQYDFDTSLLLLSTTNLSTEKAVITLVDSKLDNELRILDTFSQKSDQKKISLNEVGRFYNLSSYSSEYEVSTTSIFTIKNKKFHQFPKLSGINEEKYEYHNLQVLPSKKCLVTSLESIKVFDCTKDEPTLIDTISF
jgi:hypothetical protein